MTLSGKTTKAHSSGGSNKKGNIAHDNDNDSIDSWWSVNHPIEAQEMYHSAKLMVDYIEHDAIFIESMNYFKTLISV